MIDVLVRKLLSIKALRGRPVALLFSLFFSSFIVSMFIGFIPTALLYFGIYESIRDVCGYDKQDKFCEFTLLGIYLGCMGNFCFPFKGIALTIYTLINTSMQGFGLSVNHVHLYVRVHPGQSGMAVHPGLYDPQVYLSAMLPR